MGTMIHSSLGHETVSRHLPHSVGLLDVSGALRSVVVPFDVRRRPAIGQTGEDRDVPQDTPPHPTPSRHLSALPHQSPRQPSTEGAVVSLYKLIEI